MRMLKTSEVAIQMKLRKAAARMLNSRPRRRKGIRSRARAMRTPALKATQNQMFVDTAQSVPCPQECRNGKGSADWQSAVSQVGNLQATRGRLPVGETADGPSALRIFIRQRACCS